MQNLHRYIVDHYDLEELKTLCFGLGVNYDALPGDGTVAKARNLILYLARRFELEQLLDALRQGRPRAFEEARLDGITVEALYDALPAWEEWAASPGQHLLDARRAQIGVVGDHAHIEGGIHFYTRTSPTGKPLQRPPRAEHFTDRKHELARLLTNLQPSRVVTLCGPGGIGKTALAAEAVWTLAPSDSPPERFPDGIIFYSFYDRPDVAPVFEHIVRSYDKMASDVSVDAAYRVLSNKQTLLILDGAEEASDLQAVLEVRGDCGALVTSRARKNAMAERQDLQPLKLDEAVKLLRAWGKGRAEDDMAARSICKLVGGLPLAVRLVGRYLDQTGEPAVEYLTWLEEAPIEALSCGEHREESVEVLLARSLEQVSKAAKQILAIAGLLALAPFAVESVAHAMGLTDREVKRLLGELVNYGLLLCFDGRYIVSHALVHTYARRLNAGDKATERLVAHYTRLAKIESEMGLGGYQRLDNERPHLMAVLSHCVDLQYWEAVRSLTWAIADHLGYLDMQGHWTDRLLTIRAGLKAAKALDDQKSRVTLLCNLGVTHRLLGQLQEAINCFHQAFTISRQIGDRRREGMALGCLGMTYRVSGNLPKAADQFKKAIVIAKEVEDLKNERNWLGNLGATLKNLGELQESISYHKQALRIARQVGDRWGEGNSLGAVAAVYRRLGRIEKAIELYLQALEIAREIGDRRSEGNRLGSLGAAYRNLWQEENIIDYYRKAVYFYEEALKVAREIGDRRGEGNRLEALGAIYSEKGLKEKAIRHTWRALVIAREIGDYRREVNRSWNLGLLCEKDDPDHAVDLMSIRVDFERRIDHPDAEVHAKLVAEIKARIQFEE